MLQAWTAAHRSVFYTWKFYNELKPTQSTSCSGERRNCFPHHPQKYVPAPSSTLALKSHAASQIRKLIWQQPNPPKTREGSVFDIKVLIWFNTRHHKCWCRGVQGRLECLPSASLERGMQWQGTAIMGLQHYSLNRLCFCSHFSLWTNIFEDGQNRLAFVGEKPQFGLIFISVKLLSGLRIKRSFKLYLYRNCFECVSDS